MGKYFTVEVKPTIPNVAAGQHAAFADNDLLFDWFAFDVPKGTSFIKQIVLEVRPNGLSGAAVNERALDLIFAKTVNGAAPTSLGTANSALTADVNNSNHLIGYVAGNSYAYEGHLDSTAVAIAREAKAGLIIEGEPDSGTNVGFDRIYLAGVAGAAFDFRSLVQINNGTLDGDTFTVDGQDPRNMFAVGDVIAATTTADTSVSKSLGTIKSMPDANTIILESTTENAILNDDFIYNTTPVRILLGCEK